LVGSFALSIALASPEGAAADKVTMACIDSSDGGQTTRDAGDLLRARELFAQCSDARCPAPIRRDCNSWLEQVQQQIPSIVLGAHDPRGRDVLDANVTIDGKMRDRNERGPIEQNPGPHVIRWEREGFEPFEMRVSLRPQEKNRSLIATLSSSAAISAPAARVSSPTPSASSWPPAAYLLGGAGLVALGAFGYLGLSAKRDSDSLYGTCAPGCEHGDVQALKTKLLVADVALGVGVASLAAATWLILTRQKSAPKQAWDVHVVPLPGEARADAEIRF